MPKVKVRHLLVGVGALAVLYHLASHKHPPKQAASAEGRVIHWAHLYDPVVYLFTLGRPGRFRKMTADIAAVQPGDRVLDLGCGTGDLTKELSNRVGAHGAVIGIDAAPEMIERAQQKYGGSAEFRLAPAEKLPFDDDTFDVVVSSLVFHHLPQNLKEAAIGEVYRILKPSGRFVSIDFASAEARSTNPIARLHAHHNAESDLHDLKRVMVSAGYADVASGRSAISWIGWLSGTKSI